ncbi:CobW-like GTP-binding protein [Streptomyces sp. NPDC012693]|jgi:G3E family GTPase|uniref:CobW-like GTP-binding protein n=1 Tax=unclassified Streptomyces TaxID=2593676 RepID=UPI002030F68F|nr:CobW-like GTP-binding protein [Streptomyces sp. MSC1_001]
MITFIPLTGFLGAGKTTTMTAAALALQEQGRKVAVITNDQGVELVDTKLVRSKLDSVAEVTGGCFCCKFEDLVEAIVALVASDSVDTVIAEAVGSCTDLQATVVRPLRQYYGDDMVVAPLTTVVDPLRHLAFARAAERGEPESDLSYLFRQQVTEADVIAVNKLDTIKADRAEELLASLRTSNPKATVVGYSATTGAHLETLLDAWQAPATNEDVVLDIDYDRYAAAEAQLAWMNQELDLTAAGDGLDATAWARTVLQELSAWAAEHDAVIGHAKITVETADGDFAKLSLTESGAQPTLDRAAAAHAPAGRAVVNARVACEPDALDAAVTEAVGAADLATAVTSSATTPVSFKPSYPRPVHRLAPAGA